MKIPTAVEKKQLWEDYAAGRPARVPLRWNLNPRIILLDPALNPEGWGFAEYYRDPFVTLRVQARFQEYLATTLSRTCDFQSQLPAEWSFRVDCQNIYDAAYFGATPQFEPGQVPATTPPYTLEQVDDFLARDFSQPLENPWIKERLQFHAALVRELKTFVYQGRSGQVAPLLFGFDGPLTVATDLFGTDLFLFLAMEPEKSQRLLQTIAQACLTRNQALARLFNHPVRTESAYLADDSIQLISPAMYEELVMPVHAFWYDQSSTSTVANRRRSIHLCGDATRHFPLIAKHLGVSAFDTGFPVDHGALRRALGPAVEISGGPRVAILERGTPVACAAATRDILGSGIKTGRRFILQEANNLPPCVPLVNLAAVYETCLEYGSHSSGF